MALFTLKIPPGINHGETEAKSAGAWLTCTLVRGSAAGDVVPEKGWVQRADDAVTGVPRSMLVWKDNSDTSRIGVGTELGLFTYDLAGALTDITPSGFTPGLADSSVNTGYGGGLYGTGYYGIPRPLDSTPVDASYWSLAVWDEFLLGCCSSDGLIYQWDNNIAHDAAAVANAPAQCRGCLVAQVILLALGADGNPRKIAWSDKGFNTIWVPSDTNQAGDYIFPTAGRLMCGASVAGAALILTDIDAWVGAYGEPAIWDFTKLGDGMGAISQGCLVPASTKAFWWTLGGFRVFEGGFVNDLPCNAWDAILADINMAQKAKIVGWMNSVENEVVWVYPSANSTECDRKVSINYVTKACWITPYSRTCGCDRIENGNPLAMSTAGLIYDHEKGYAYDGLSPKVRSGPITVGEGDKVMGLAAWIPDQRTFGEATATFYMKDRPLDDYTVYGPESATEYVDLMIEGRILEVEFTFTGAGAIGEPQLDVIPRGRR